MPLKNPFSRQPEQPKNDALLNAIIRMASENTPEAKHYFYTTLLKSTILLGQEKGMNRPVLFDDGEGGAILAAFTDIERLMKVLPDIGGYGMMSFRDMCVVALSNGIHTININPQIGPGCYVTRQEMEALAMGAMPDVDVPAEPALGGPTFVPMGDPSLPSEEVLNKLMETAASLLEQEPSVKAGYLISTAGSDEPDAKSYLTLALYFSYTASMDTKNTFTQQVVNKLEAVLGGQLRIIWLDGERYKAVASVVPPVYERSTRQ